MVLIMPGEIQQLMIAFIFALVYFLLVSVAAPFKDRGDDFFAKGCGFSLAALFFFSTILKVGVFTESVDSFLSVQVRNRFSFDARFVTVGMISSIVVAVALATAMSLHQLREAAKKPIIRLLATKAPPELPMSEDHRWHMFLSHSKPPSDRTASSQTPHMLTTTAVSGSLEYGPGPVRHHQAAAAAALAGCEHLP